MRATASASADEPGTAARSASATRRDEVGVVAGQAPALVGAELGVTGARRAARAPSRAGGRALGGAAARRAPDRRPGSAAAASAAAGSSDVAAAPAERLAVLVDGDAVELDGPLDGGGRHRERAGLVRGADQHEVRHHVVAEQALGERDGVEVHVAATGAAGDRGEQRRRPPGTPSPASVTIAPVGTLLVDTTARLPGSELGEIARVGGDQQVEAEVRVGLTGRDRVRRVDRIARQLHVRDDRPALLAEPGLVEAGDVEPVEQGGRRERLADRDDAGAADAREVEVEEPVDRRTRRGVRLGQVVAEHRDLA